MSCLSFWIGHEPSFTQYPSAGPTEGAGIGGPEPSTDSKKTLSPSTPANTARQTLISSVSTCALAGNPLWYTTSKSGQMFARTQGPELSQQVALCLSGWVGGSPGCKEVLRAIGGYQDPLLGLRRDTRGWVALCVLCVLCVVVHFSL
jgi:hypothetical protein